MALRRQLTTEIERKLTMTSLTKEMLEIVPSATKNGAVSMDSLSAAERLHAP